MSSLNIERSARPRLHEDDPGLVLAGDARIVLRELTAIELGERTGALDPRRPAAHHHDVQRAVVDEVGVPVRVLPLAQGVVLEPHGVRKCVHRKGVLSGPLGAEEVDLRAEREHEVVVGDRRQLRELHLARVEIDSRHGCLMDRRVLLPMDQVAQRMTDGGLLDQTGRELIQERLEGVIVVPVHQHDLDVGALELAHGADPGKGPRRERGRVAARPGRLRAGSDITSDPDGPSRAQPHPNRMVQSEGHAARRGSTRRPARTPPSPRGTATRPAGPDAPDRRPDRPLRHSNSSVPRRAPSALEARRGAPTCSRTPGPCQTVGDEAGYGLGSAPERRRRRARCDLRPRGGSALPLAASPWRRNARPGGRTGRVRA